MNNLPVLAGAEFSSINWEVNESWENLLRKNVQLEAKNRLIQNKCQTSLNSLYYVKFSLILSSLRIVLDPSQTPFLVLCQIKKYVLLNLLNLIIIIIIIIIIRGTIFTVIGLLIHPCKGWRIIVHWYRAFNYFKDLSLSLIIFVQESLHTRYGWLPKSFCDGLCYNEFFCISFCHLMVTLASWEHIPQLLISQTMLCKFKANFLSSFFQRVNFDNV